MIGGMTGAASGVDLHAAFVRARKRAEHHMIGCERDGSSWREETISELVWQAARPYVTYADFTRHQEAAVGADWLWWWIDHDGECFGMLVQAKRLFCRGPDWSLDFQAKRGDQMRALLSTADRFSVPAAYVVYMGSVDYRASYTSHISDPTALEHARKATVSVLAALLAQYSFTPRDGAATVLNSSIPLEDLADTSAALGPIRDLNLRDTTSELRAFLLERQSGARRIAQMIFKTVSEARSGMFSLDVAERGRVDTAAVFDDLPLDSAHFGVPYFQHVLRGLRSELPSYVQDMLAGRPPPTSVTNYVGGIVAIRC
ncbi:MAG TPA: hypothetical protein VHB02_01030 [Acidimicrobiales bacterium]|nr:hypothetical protein [Acidimicrobiales bacterium]